MSLKQLTAVTLIGLGLLVAGGAQAVTPANTQLTNSATLTYSGNPTGLSDSVTVTIELVPAAPSIAQGATAPNTSVNKAENQSYSASYVVQSNANGPDTYTVAAAYTSTNDVTGAAAPTTSVASLTLGATAASASSTGTTVTVPADGASDGAVNGLAVGDDVVIGAGTYEITAITDNAAGSSSITLDGSPTVNVGDGIYEYKNFTTDVTDVGNQGGGTNRLDLQTTVTSDTDGSAQYLLDVDINIVAITIVKFVRETSGPCGTTGCGGAVTTSYDNGVDGANIYYDQGVEAAPGDTLEYLLVITTSTASISGAVVDDDLPDFSTYVAGTTRLNAIAVSDEGAAPIFPLDSGADDGGLLIDDDGARTAGNEGTGDVGTSQTVHVTYKVTVDN